MEVLKKFEISVLWWKNSCKMVRKVDILKALLSKKLNDTTNLTHEVTYGRMTLEMIPKI